MKTFAEFLDSNEGDDDGIFKALKIAAQDHRSDVMSFLRRLASQNPDIQIELDQMNHRAGNMPARHKNGDKNDDPEGRADVIVPNSADMASGDSQV